MALKLLKINIAMEVKADPQDQEDLRERVMESLQIMLESDELEFSLDEEEQEEYEGEE